MEFKTSTPQFPQQAGTGTEVIHNMFWKELGAGRKYDYRTWLSNLLRYKKLLSEEIDSLRKGKVLWVCAGWLESYWKFFETSVSSDDFWGFY